VNLAGFGFANTPALLAQVIEGDPGSSYPRVVQSKYGRNGFVTELAVAQVKAVAD
jgi:hypothetical protein